jgi:hypothetical protein
MQPAANTQQHYTIFGRGGGRLTLFLILFGRFVRVDGGLFGVARTLPSMPPSTRAATMHILFFSLSRQ